MLSVIVPVYNNHELTEECLSVLLETTRDFELVLVDNGSDPPIKPPFSGFVETTVIRNDENKGFPVAVNQGIAAAKGDVIVLLNNDVVVTPGALNRLAGYLDRFAIVAPVTNHCAGMQRVMIGRYESKAELFDEAHYYEETVRGEAQEANFVIGFCMAFRKSLWEEIGPFDESLWPCSGEEIDFCFKAREAGYGVAIAHDVYVHHYGSRTFKDMQDAEILDYEKMCKRNDAHLEKRWGKGFWLRQTIHSSPEPKGLCLNLGCGYRPLPGFVNIDSRAEVGPDVVCDVLEGLPYEDDSVDMVRADDFLEHVPLGRTVQVVTEIWRVLKPGGIFESLTPSTDGRGAFQDPTHCSFWNRNSWFYYSVPEFRNLYGIEADFDIRSIEDMITNEAAGIVHTHVIAAARK